MYDKGHKRMRMLSAVDSDRVSYGLSLYEDKRDNVILSSEIGTSDFVEFVHKKAEKHVAVSYMFTNFLSDTEPLKWKLRETALSFLSDIYTLSSSKQKGAYGLTDILSSVDEMRSLYRIMRTAGHISQMNADFIDEELNSIQSTISKRLNRTEPAQNVIIDKAIFNIDKIKESTDTTIKDNNIYKGHKALAKTASSKEQQKVQSYNSKIVSDNKDKVEFRKKIKQQSARADGANRKTNKEARRESIKNILQERGKLTIKDIAVAISGCSEKTIQRELRVLIKDKIIKREGERRWSVYSLA